MASYFTNSPPFSIKIHLNYYKTHTFLQIQLFQQIKNDDPHLNLNCIKHSLSHSNVSQISPRFSHSSTNTFVSQTQYFE